MLQSHLPDSVRLPLPGSEFNPVDQGSSFYKPKDKLFKSNSDSYKEPQNLFIKSQPSLASPKQKIIEIIKIEDDYNIIENSEDALNTSGYSKRFMLDEVVFKHKIILL